MKWPWSKNISREEARLRAKCNALEEKLRKTRAQRDKARTQRDQAKEQRDEARVERDQAREQAAQSPQPLAAPAESEHYARLVTALEERQLYYVLHQNVIKDLEYAEAHPLPLKLEYPLPPHELRFRIGGLRSGARFLNIGECVAADLDRICRENGHAPGDFSSVLDFGCGCGRVLRQLPAVFPNARFEGADIDPEAVDWCRENLPFLNAGYVLPHQPPSALPSDSYDFIFAISVFTHLPHELERAWLAELGRIAKPGALLILTYMPEERAADHFTPEMALENHDGFTYYRTSNTPGLPDFYQVSYHSEAAARRIFGDFMEVLAIIPKGVNNHQHALVAKAR